MTTTIRFFGGPIFGEEQAEAWRCKKCRTWWMCGPGPSPAPPRCWGDCGGTEFEPAEIVRTTASAEVAP